METKEKAMTRAQQRFLLDRLETAYRAKPHRYGDISIPEPANVKAARALSVKADRVINAWEKHVSAAKEKRHKSISTSHGEAKTKILFGEEKAALKAVENFENAAF
jgi:hypothetical protein